MHSAIYKIIVSLTFLSVVTVLMPQKIHAGTYTLKPIDDTYADQLAPGNNYSYLNYLLTRKSIAPAHTYLKFSLEGIPSNEQIAGAVFGLYSYYGYHTWVTLNHILDDSWDERLVTWNDRPADGSQGIELNRQYLDSAYNWIIWDMFGNNMWDAAADQADGYVSLLVGTMNSDLHFASKEFFINEQKPFLTITTTPVSTPIPPSCLLLGAGLICLLGIRKKYE